MKIHQSLVSSVVRGLSLDMSMTYPDLLEEIQAQERFTLIKLEEQGLAFATLVLPAAGKWLDHCLAEGRLLANPPLYCGRKAKTVYPKYLSFLWALVFDETGVLRDFPDHTAVFYLRQGFYFAKKLNIQCEKERTYAAIQGFESLEASMVRSRPGTWDADEPKWSVLKGHPLFGEADLVRQPDLFPGLAIADTGEAANRVFPWSHFHRLCRRVVASWGDLDVYSLEPKHGPGAVADKEGLKYELRTYPRRLASVFPPDWFASTDLVDRTISDKELSSVMRAVPKTQKGPRLIAAEPTAHQWIQGGLQRWLEERVKGSALGLSIDFKDQSLSQDLARESSLTGQYATIDLSEASDRLTTRLVEYVFQANHNLLDALHACRTRSIRIPSDLHPSGSEVLVMLKKFSTMGSAVTFPIQTIVFTLLGHFALMCVDEDWDCSPEAMRSRASRIRVFGDDIIIDNDAYGTLVQLLTEVGLKVNRDKSFSKGAFREACGMDAFDGVDVTPAYIRSPHDENKPESLASVVECSNNFHKKGLWHTAAVVLTTIPSRLREKLVTGHQDIWSLSIFTFTKGVPPGLKARWNPHLQRREVYALAMLAKSTRVSGTGEAALLQYFTEDPSSNPNLTDWTHGQQQRPLHSIRERWVKEA